MELKNKNIGFALTGSFCMFEEILEIMKLMIFEYKNIIPIISSNVREMDTKFYKASQLKYDIEKITKNNIIDTIQKSEPIGPQNLIDLLLIAPCTGNTISKIANGINDTPVTMACKSTLRNNKPVVIFVSTNDGLSSNAKNIGYLLNTKNIYFVPFNQDNFVSKPYGLLSDPNLIIKTIDTALNSSQVSPTISSN